MASLQQQNETTNININSHPSDTEPIIGGVESPTRILTRIGDMLRINRNARNDPDGYIEFGITESERSSRTLGTFAGVFSPVALSMFSALIFIRVGFIVGNAGLWITLLQFIIAYAILVSTVASVCAISTNGAVEGGGVYFMISRTLGPDFGGSIGTLFFLANIVGCALCITGCAEGLIENFGPSGYLVGKEGALLPDGRWWRFLYCTLINLVILIVCLTGAAMFAKTSVSILAIVTICLFSTYISFLWKGPMEVEIPAENHIATVKYVNYTGLSGQTLRDNLYDHYGPDYTSNDGNQVNFAIVFGVLFSGVTGIMAGANMSGELKSPSRSIPRGTLSAVTFTFVCYIALAVLIAATTPNELSRNNYLFLMPINIWPPFIAIGILTATFSAALSNLIGSSRVLEALAKDRVFGSLLNVVTRGTWKGNPVVAVMISFSLVQGILLIGSLNAIAQINSVLFMLSYLATNLACLGIELTGAPNFRPSFKYFNWFTCFMGLLGTLIMMFVINPIYSSSSIILCLILVIALHIFSPASQGTQWGSISQALMFHQVRKYLLMLDSRKDHVKFWRPQMLLLVSTPRSCCPLIDFVNDLKKGGLYVIGHVKVGDFNDVDETDSDPVGKEYIQWLSLIDHMKVKAFAELTVAKSVREGAQHLIRISGMGAMKPNTIVMGFYDGEKMNDFFESENSMYRTTEFNMDVPLFPTRSNDDDKSMTPQEYVGLICDVLRMKKNICLCRHFHRLNKSDINTSIKNSRMKFIDVWPVNVFDPKNEDPFDVVSMFMMQLACIINMLPVWKNLHLRVFLCETENVNGTSNFEVNNATFERSAEYKLKELLKMLRIHASIYQIAEWSRNVDFMHHISILKQFTENSENEVNVLTDENINRSKLYMQSVNQIIKNRSDQTAVTFMYLAAPPKTKIKNWREKSEHYLDLLTELTSDLPPTILVHGINAVTSTTL